MLMCIAVPNHNTLLQTLLPLLVTFAKLTTITTYYYLLLLIITTHTYTIYTTIILPLPLRLILLPISTYSLAKLYSNYTIMAGRIGPTV